MLLMMTFARTLTSFSVCVTLALRSGNAQAQMMGEAMMGGMMWLMVIFLLLIAAVLILAIAALVKHLFKKW
ncbi:hypothetical protein Bpet4575 [Bordetella petrii]|uniref:Phage-related membrane protein n=2 Tax=Bordetella petrii TaxID=94624 RepID=A9IEY2_BORPD|nr:hypothetical protein Bpet4575 [Bordetella petrii]